MFYEQPAYRFTSRQDLVRFNCRVEQKKLQLKSTFKSRVYFRNLTIFKKKIEKRPILKALSKIL